MRPPKTKPPAGANRTEGLLKTPKNPDVALLATGASNEQRIAELQVAQEAALAAGDKATLKKLFDQWNAARAARSQEQLQKLDARGAA